MILYLYKLQKIIGFPIKTASEFAFCYKMQF